MSHQSLPDIESALAALPLFPLPTVLFPSALLPLHVFEPRYRTMIQDVLETHRTLAVVLVTNERRLDGHGHPEIACVAGAGVIIDYTELPNGRFNILLRGRARVALEELPFGEKPYRRARGTVLPRGVDAADPAELTALLSAANSFAARVRESEPSFDFSLPRDASPSVLADLCAHHLLLDARERQQALETLDVRLRVQRVAEALTLQRLSLTSDPLDLN